MFRVIIGTLWLGISAGATELPLFFEPNQGQAPPRVEFLSRANGVASYLTGPEAQILVGNSAIRMELVGAAKTAGEGVGRLPGLSSYFAGRTARDWHTGIPQYDRVRYRDVYPGIDLVYYGNQGKLEYDLVLGPGADPSRIRLTYSGLKNLRLDKEGNLVLSTESGEIRQRRPLVYQEADGKRTAVAASYRLAGRGEVRLDVAAHDTRRRLTVDPVLEYGTFIGANGNGSATGVKVDSAGNVYLAGSVPAAPVTAGAQFTSIGNAVVIKFSPSQDKILYWATLTPDGQTIASALDIDAAGNAYVCGSTSSTQFPLMNAFQSAHGTWSNFVSKLAPDGQSLVYSTYLSGSQLDYLNGIAVDASGNAFVTGQTTSKDFPTLNALQPRATFSWANALLAKFSPSGTLLFSTFFGGSYVEGAAAIALDRQGYPVIAGMAQSSDFPFKNPIQTQIGTEAAFAAKFTPDGQSVVFATALAGTWSSADSLAFDPQNNIWVGGWAGGNDMTLKNPIKTQGNGRSMFVSKLSADGSQLLYQSYFGGSVEEDLAAQQGMAVDSSGDLYLAGRTFSPDFPVKDSLIQFQKKPVAPGNPVQGANGFVTKLSPDGQSLIYSTLLAGTQYQDQVLALALDSAGAAWVTGNTGSSDFPTKNAYQSTLNGSGAFTTFLVELTDGTSAPQTGSSLTASPGILNFSATLGSAQPAQQTVSIGVSTGSATPFTASASTSSGGSWLSIGAAGGTTPAQLSVTANPVGLAVGSYSGTIHVTATNATPVDITVWLTVSSPVSILLVSSPNLAFQGSGQIIVYVSTSNGSSVNVTASASTSSGGNWLSATPTSFTTTAMLTVTANASGMAQGTYNGIIHLAPAGGGVGVDINATLTVPQQQISLTASPASVTFQAAVGGASPAAQTVNIASSGGAASYSAAVTAGASWLSVSPSSGTLPARLSISANTAGLGSGVDSGTVHVSSPSGGAVDVSVTLLVQAPAPAVLTSISPSSVPVNAVQPAVTLKGTGFVTGSAVHLGINSADQTLATTFVDANTLQTSLAGVTLSVGQTLSLTVVNPGAVPSNAMTLTVTGAVPQISSHGVMNAASFVSGPVAPGELISIAGAFLGPAQGSTAAPDASGTFPEALAGVQVLFDGRPAPILYVSASQVNAIVPFSLAGAQQTAVQVEYQDRQSAALAVPVAASAPGIFTADSSGSGQGAILDSDMSPNLVTHPAAPGSVVALYATGAGQMNQSLVDGQVVTQLAKPLASATVTIDGQQAQVVYCGSAPTLVAGMLQVNVVVPATVQTGPAVPVSLQIGDTAAQPGVTLAIQ